MFPRGGPEEFAQANAALPNFNQEQQISHGYGYAAKNTTNDPFTLQNPYIANVVTAQNQARARIIRLQMQDEHNEIDPQKMPLIQNKQTPSTHNIFMV